MPPPPLLMQAPPFCPNFLCLLSSFPLIWRLVPRVSLLFGGTGAVSFSCQLILFSSPGASNYFTQFLSFLFSQLLILMLSNGCGFCLQLILFSSPGASRFFLLAQLLMVSLQFPSFEIEENFHANGRGSLSSAHSFSSP